MNSQKRRNVETAVKILANEYGTGLVKIRWIDCDYNASSNTKQNRITICPRIMTRNFNSYASVHVKHDIKNVSHFTVVILHEFGHIMNNHDLLDEEQYYDLDKEDRASLWAQNYINKHG